MLDTLSNISKYTLVIMSLLCFIVGTKHKTKHKELSHLHFYALASFSQGLVYIISKFIFESGNNKAISLSILLFIIVEITSIFFFFYKTIIITASVKRYLLHIYWLFIIFYLLFFMKSDFSLSHVVSFYYIESVVVLTPCFIYLFQLFLKPPILDLLEEPSFWFNAGILIYFILTLPTFFMINFFVKDSVSLLIDVINYLGYILIFSFLIRAYLCKPKPTI